MPAAPPHQRRDVQVRVAVAVGAPGDEARRRGLARRDGRVHDQEALDALRGTRQGERERQAEQAAPVLHNERDVGQVEGGDQVEQGGAVEGVGVGRVGGGLVAAAEAQEVWSDDTTPGWGAALAGGGGVVEEDCDHFAIEVRPGWLAVEAEEYFCRGGRGGGGGGGVGADVGGFVDVGHAEVAVSEVVWLIWEVWEIVETVFGRAKVGDIWLRHVGIEHRSMWFREAQLMAKEREMAAIEERKAVGIRFLPSQSLLRFLRRHVPFESC